MYIPFWLWLIAVITAASTGIYVFFEEFLYFAIKGATLGFLSVVLTSAPIIWQIAQELFVELNVSAYIQSTWAAIPENARLVLGFFQVPEAISVLLTFGMVKFIMRAVPGL